MSPIDSIRAGVEREQEGDLLEATAAYQTALDDPDPSVIADANYHLGRIAWRQGRHDVAIERYELARSLAARAGNVGLRAVVENGIGAVHYAREAYAQARASYRLALELSEEPSHRGRVMLNLGVLANVEGDFETAKSSYRRSRDLFRAIEDSTGEAQAWHNLGALHADLEEWDDADHAYATCLALCEARDDRQMMAHALVGQAEVACARERFDDALPACDEAIGISAQIGDELGRGEALRWKGHALRRLSEFASAERALDEAIRIAHRVQDTLLEAEASRDMAASVGERAGRAAARPWADRALALFDQLGAEDDGAELRAGLASLSAGGPRTPE